MIYFLRAEQDTNALKAGWIKIGCTTRLSVRLKQIAAEIGHMPTVLAILDGGFAEERALHRKFDFAGRFREWFYPDPELLLLIETDGRPWDGMDEVLKPVAVTIKGSEEWKAWLEEAAVHCRLSVSALLDHAVARYVKAEGFGKKPPER